MTTQVFKIVNDVDDDIFIGSTKQSSLSRLLGKYRTNMRKGTHSSKILEKMKSLGTEHFKIVLLEKHTDSLLPAESATLKECKKKWINLLKPTLNQKHLDDHKRMETSLNGGKIWRENNQDKIKQYTIDNKEKKKEYDKKNRERIRKYQEEYSKNKKLTIEELNKNFAQRLETTVASQKGINLSNKLKLRQQQQRHNALVRKSEKYKCSLCGRIMSSPRNLLNHVDKKICQILR